MSRKYTVSLDLNKNELLNARLQNLSSDPLSPVEGQIYYNTQAGETRFYDGTQWVSGGSVKFGTLSARPAASKHGVLYIATDTQTLYLDNGSTWIQVSVNPQDLSDAISYLEGYVSDAIFDHASEVSTHGVVGEIVGTENEQTLTNKTISDQLTFNNGGASSTIQADGNNLYITANQDLVLGANNRNVEINADSQLNINSSTNINGNLNVPTITGATGSYDGSITLQDSETISQIHIDGVTKNIELLPGNGSKAFYGSAATAGNEIAKISDLQSLANGLQWKAAVNVLADQDVPLSGSTPIVIDSHTLSDGYRVFLKNQNDANENGVYDLFITDTTYQMVRSSDMLEENNYNASFFVIEGAQYGATSWVQINEYAGSYSELEWVQFSGQGSYVGSNTVYLDGNQINVVADSSRGITSDGDGLYVKVTDGITYTNDGELGLSLGTGLEISSGSLSLSQGYGVRKHAQTIGDGISTSIDVVHNFATEDVTVTVFDTSTKNEVITDVIHSLNKVTIICANVINENEFRVVVTG